MISTDVCSTLAQDEVSKPVLRGDGESSRPSRGGGGIFDAPEGDSEAPAPSAEWQAATAGIAADMRAHLQRRQKKAEADLIGPSLFRRVIDFFGSQYFSNVRRSLALFLGAWLWYVLNTKTYIRPEYDD